MTRTISIGLLVGGLALSTFAVLGQAPAKPQRNFFAVLQEGQPVSVREVNGRYEINVLKDAPLSHKVVEIGADHLVVEDVTGVTRTSIPIYSIRSIVVLKIPGR